MFLFFGLVAVNGSYYVQLERLDWLAFGLSIAVGLLATAILVVNNVRDIETDRRVGKRTLAVRLGRERTRRLYALLIAAAFVRSRHPARRGRPGLGRCWRCSRRRWPPARSPPCRRAPTGPR